MSANKWCRSNSIDWVRNYSKENETKMTEWIRCLICLTKISFKYNSLYHTWIRMHLLWDRIAFHGSCMHNNIKNCWLNFSKRIYGTWKVTSVIRKIRKKEWEMCSELWGYMIKIDSCVWSNEFIRNCEWRRIGWSKLFFGTFNSMDEIFLYIFTVCFSMPLNGDTQIIVWTYRQILSLSLNELTIMFCLLPLNIFLSNNLPALNIYAHK